MSAKWSRVPLGDVLVERRETPSFEDLLAGRIQIVEKIGFNDGQIQLRADPETNTGMILIRPGDLVVSGINAAKGAIAIYHENNGNPIAATIHYGAYTPKKDRVDIKFLWWMLRSKLFRELLLEYVPGGIKTELKAKRLLPIPIPLPSLLAEQKRIVARIEELAAQINEARSLRQQAAEGIEAILPTKLRHLSSGFQLSGVLGDVLTSPPRNGWSARCDNADGGTAVLSLSAVTGFVYRPTEFKRTALPAPKDGHFWLNPGDLLITRSNTPELVGHAAIFNGSPTPCIYPDLMMRLAFRNNAVEQKFVWYWLQAPQTRDFIKQNAKGTSPTMKKISQGTVMAIPFPSSLSLPKQLEIVTELDVLQAEVEKLKSIQAETAAEFDALLPSILDRAFKGEL
ncbi:MAG: restriction endonuclease subunit S [Proteobacteria bacterium]|nr:restriction endonuclease subunit S [Pseudomonadota bacterium]